MIGGRLDTEPKSGVIHVTLYEELISDNSGEVWKDVFCFGVRSSETEINRAGGRSMTSGRICAGAGGQAEAAEESGNSPANREDGESMGDESAVFATIPASSPTSSQQNRSPYTFLRGEEIEDTRPGGGRREGGISGSAKEIDSRYIGGDGQYKVQTLGVCTSSSVGGRCLTERIAIQGSRNCHSETAIVVCLR
jgi:hypothetical protein